MTLGSGGFGLGLGWLSPPARTGRTFRFSGLRGFWFGLYEVLRLRADNFCGVAGFVESEATRNRAIRRGPEQVWDFTSRPLVDKLLSLNQE